MIEAPIWKEHPDYFECCGNQRKIGHRGGLHCQPYMGQAEKAMTSRANDIQHGGTHYKKLGIEPWDYVAANDLGFFEGNAIKYLTRWQEKGGVEDLKKAGHYIQKLIEIEQAKVPTK